MADERILTAPTIKQTVNITISGESKLHDFASTLNDLVDNKPVYKYWKSQEELIKDVTKACEIYSQNVDNKENATELLKLVNALKAAPGTYDLPSVFQDFKDISHCIEQATLKVGSLDSAFDVINFKTVFKSFETMRAYGVDLDRLFKHFEIASELKNQIEKYKCELSKYEVAIISLHVKNKKLEQELDNLKSKK